MYLFTPSPSDDESLSSWRQRAACENGYSLFPTGPDLRRSDPDAGTPSLHAWLAKEFGLPKETVGSLSLTSFSNVLGVDAAGRTKWLIPIRYSKSTVKFGPVFCPKCLREGSYPFFRKHWRLAFECACTHHGCELVEICPSCGLLIWPSCSTSVSYFGEGQIQLGVCPRCHFDLTDALTRPAEAGVPATLSLRRILATNLATMGDGMDVTGRDFFDALSTVSQLFLRRRAARAIVRSKAPWGEIAERGLEFGSGRVEQLPIALRSDVVSTALDVLKDWPTSFLKFCDACQLSAQHFSDAETSVPTWMLEQVDVEIRRKLYCVPEEAVVAAEARLAAAGVPCTKQALAAEVGSDWCEAVARRFRRAASAAEREAIQFVDALELHGTIQRRRRSSRYAALRDISVVAAAVLLQIPVAKAASENLAGLRRTAEAIEPRSDVSCRLAALFRRSMDEASGLALDLWPLDADRVGVRGLCDVGRSAGRLFGRLCRDLHLQRDPAVFAATLQAHEKD